MTESDHLIHLITFMRHGRSRADDEGVLIFPTTRLKTAGHCWNFDQDKNR